MKISEIRENVAEYIKAVQPRTNLFLLTDELLMAIEYRSCDISDTMKVFLNNELLVAKETGDFAIHDMIERLRQTDRHIQKGKLKPNQIGCRLCRIEYGSCSGVISTKANI